MTAAKADGREPQQRTRTTVYGVTEPSEYACGEQLISNHFNAHHFDFGFRTTSNPVARASYITKRNVFEMTDNK